MAEETSSTDIIDTPEKLHAALDYWKNVTFSKTYIKLDDAVKSMHKPDRLVEGRKEYAARWFLSRPGTRRAATLWTAVVWRWNSDMETGNFVPPGAIAPARLAESRIQSAPSPLCQFSYGVDTTHDASLWEAQQVFEKHITSNDKFNPSKKERRNWQDGNDPDRSMFSFTSQIFLKRSAYTKQKEANISYTLHHWIREATKKGSQFFANDERPEVFESDEDLKLRSLAENGLRPLKPGDLVWLSFSVEFFIGGKFWVTNFIPYEFVRVGTVSTDLLGDIRSNDPEEVAGPRERLGIGMGSISVSSDDKPDDPASPSKAPSKAHLEVSATSSSTTTDPDRNEFILTPEDAWKYRHTELFPPPTSPSEWENSDTEQSAECLNDHHPTGNSHNDQYDIDQPMEVDDEDGPGSTVVHMATSVAGTPIPMAHLAIPIANVSLPVADVPTPMDDIAIPVADASLPVSDASLPVADASLPVADVSQTAVDLATPSANVAIPVANVSLPIADVSNPVRKAVDDPPIASKPAPKLRAKKRAASTERPAVDADIDGGVMVGGRRLRDRRDKGKAVAR
ncbi:hypothetical protein GSI_04568 [Ganoderma sinense ZZ0214-1]|uniref:Uncharacterized protein n=1 Tax=Ganoderma sinense ZZ0214-1 TaxID=1077348 RepID=A0A2G8SH71_9APHY|nr:hypothetical protein GSI_04568 [Ganoderma sinense ZZ0214-1]